MSATQSVKQITPCRQRSSSDFSASLEDFAEETGCRQLGLDAQGNHSNSLGDRGEVSLGEPSDRSNRQNPQMPKLGAVASAFGATGVDARQHPTIGRQFEMGNAHRRPTLYLNRGVIDDEVGSFLGDP